LLTRAPAPRPRYAYTSRRDTGTNDYHARAHFSSSPAAHSTSTTIVDLASTSSKALSLAPTHPTTAPTTMPSVSAGACEKAMRRVCGIDQLGIKGVITTALATALPYASSVTKNWKFKFRCEVSGYTTSNLPCHVAVLLCCCVAVLLCCHVLHGSLDWNCLPTIIRHSSLPGGGGGRGAAGGGGGGGGRGAAGGGGGGGGGGGRARANA
jgi:hypothetical protein